jgi:DnaJ-class molecular chaperone
MLWVFPGKMFSDKDRCRACHGKKIVRENKVLEVHIDKGMKNGQKIVFHGEGDQNVCIVTLLSLAMS